MTEHIFYTAAALSELTGPKPLRRELNGWALLLVREGDEIYAFRNLCPHLAVRMNAARVENGAIICPNHRARFDLRTGRCLDSALSGVSDGLAPLSRFETRVVDERVEVALPAQAARRR